MKSIWGPSAVSSLDKRHVVIVGGGVYGALLAWQASIAGAHVVLIEAQDIAAGASGGPGERGIRANKRDRRELPLVVRAVELWDRYQSEIDGGVGFRQTGSLTLAECPFGAREAEVLSGIQARAGMQNAFGALTELVNRDELLHLEPEIAPRVLAALYRPHDGLAKHEYATQRFAELAQECGAEIYTGMQATGLIVSHTDRVVAIATNHGDVRVPGDLVLLCNSGVPKLLRTVDEPLDVNLFWEYQPQMLWVRTAAEHHVNHLINHLQRKLSIKQLADGTVMISGGQSVVGETLGATVVHHGALSALSLNLRDAIECFPFIDDGEIRAVNGTRRESVSVDGLPVVDRSCRAENLYFGFGWTGHGFAIAPAIVELLVRWLACGNRPDELRSFAYRRFSGVV